MSTKNFITFIWLVLAVFVGIGMYVLKYEVKKLELELAALNESINKDQDNIHILKAEWSHLNNPTRIKSLTDRFIKLEPIKPEQIVAIAELPVSPENTGRTNFASSEEIEKELNNKLKKLVSTRD